MFYLIALLLLSLPVALLAWRHLPRWVFAVPCLRSGIAEKKSAKLANMKIFLAM